MTSNVGLQLKAFFYAGIVIPVTLHVLAAKKMPWWPDTVSMNAGTSTAHLMTPGS